MIRPFIKDIVTTGYTTIVLIYAACLVVLAGLLLWTSSLGAPDLVGTALALLLFPALVLLPISLLFRRWVLAMLVMVPALAFFVVWGPLFLPRGENPSETGRQLSLLTFNIHGYYSNQQPLIDIIRDADSDVVALQEVSEQAGAYIAETLKEEYPYQALHPAEIAYMGQAILSKYPITDDYYWLNTEYALTGNQRVQLDVEGRALVVYNVHPPTPIRSVRQFDVAPHTQSIEDVLSRIETETAPLILLGDFNMTEQFRSYGAITALLSDSYRESGDIGPGFTFPATRRLGLPLVRSITLPGLMRIDYVFHNEALKTLQCSVLTRTGSSDHRPVRSVLEFVE